MLQACGLEGWRGDWEGQENFILCLDNHLSQIVDRYIVWIKLRISSNKYVSNAQYHIVHQLRITKQSVSLLPVQQERAGKGHKKAC